MTVLAVLSCSVFGLSCDGGKGKAGDNADGGGTAFTVRYIDVGDGDATFIRFPDGTVTLIDCAEGDGAYSSLRSVLDEYNVTRIDNLIVTHLHSTSAGNAVKLISEYPVGRAYLPCVKESGKNALYDGVVNAVNDPDKITESARGITVGDKDCFIAFLSPLPFGENGSFYNEYNLEEYPSDKMTDDCSAVMLLSYKGVRFLFTGDCSSDVERAVLSDFRSGMTERVFSGFSFCVENLDFLKVAKRGGAGASSGDFLDYLKPERAVISVSGLNSEGCPSSAVIRRITEANPDAEIYRTDVCGDIEVSVAVDGKISVRAQNI